MKYRYEVRVETRWGWVTGWYTDDLAEAIEHASREREACIYDTAEHRTLDYAAIPRGKAPS